MVNGVQIIKMSGETEPFDAKKVEWSLKKAGVGSQLAEDIVGQVENQVKQGMTTKEIYQLAFSLLKKYEKPLAARYNLKKAIFQLGPEGFLFEKFIGKLLENQGYRVRVGQIVQGKCVSHEIDVIAEKENEHVLVECKFHNHQGIKSDVQTALYTKARFDDVQEGFHLRHQNVFHNVWLVTNTKLTKDAIDYGQCRGMKLIGWSYPKGESLQDLIEISRLYPVTCLSVLSGSQKKAMMARGIILCKELAENPKILEEFSIKSFKKKQIIEEIEYLKIL